MQSSQITFKNLKHNISDAIKESSLTTHTVINKIADEIHQIQTGSVEPGVEIAQGLSTIINMTIKDSVRLNCDLSIISKGILIGAFRSSNYVRLEAHKTIRILVNEILQSGFKYTGDAKQTVDGLLAAITTIAIKRRFNIQEALKITVEDILLSSNKIDPQFAQKIRIYLEHFIELTNSQDFLKVVKEA